MIQPPRPPYAPHTVVHVVKRPNCDICTVPTPALYDFKTYHGPWANGCQWHYIMHRAYASLGLGKGQYLIERNETEGCEGCNRGR